MFEAGCLQRHACGLGHACLDVGSYLYGLNSSLQILSCLSVSLSGTARPACVVFASMPFAVIAWRIPPDPEESTSHQHSCCDLAAATAAAGRLWPCERLVGPCLGR